MRRGWFVIPGVQDGDRHLRDQLKGLPKAFEIARDKEVLDLGCAEGLISIAFANSGAKSVHGVEIVETHVKVARELAQKITPPPTFECIDLSAFAARELAQGEQMKRYDVVVALAILHKLRNPKEAVEYCMQATREWIVVRTAGATPGYIQDTRSGNKRYEVLKRFTRNGFKLEAEARGHLNEWMGYFRRA